MEEEGAPWELLYNLGTALVQRGGAADDAAAEGCLEQAAEACKEVRAQQNCSAIVNRKPCCVSPPYFCDFSPPYFCGFSGPVQTRSTLTPLCWSETPLIVLSNTPEAPHVFQLEPSHAGVISLSLSLYV